MRRITRPQLIQIAAALALVVVAGVLVFTRSQADSNTAATKTETSTTTSSPAPLQPAPPTIPGTTQDPNLQPVPEGETLTATPHGTIKGYDQPDGAPTVDVIPTYYDHFTALPVFEQAKGWLHVRLAVPRTTPNPNTSTTWVKVSDVDVGHTPWKIVINLSTTHLQLYNKGAEVMNAPVGIGLDKTPTVTGDFFATFIQPPPKDPGTGKDDPSYGPWELITSGHSEVITTWQGFPDGILAIHGPVDGDAAIGKKGGKMSNGCIRMHVIEQRKLADVLPGSPIQIVAA